MTRSSVDTFDPRGLMQREVPATSLHGDDDEYAYNCNSFKGGEAEEVKITSDRKESRERQRHST